MQTKLIVRVLDAAGDLLGWDELMAEARGDGRLWATAPSTVTIERQGVAATVSVHWADLNVEARTPFPTPQPVALGARVTVISPGPVFVVGPQAGGLPPVTVRTSVSISPPTGDLAAVGRG